MSIRIKRRWILLIGCLAISGCTEKTIIREVPAASPESGVPEGELDDGSNPDKSDTVGDTDTDTDTNTNTNTNSDTEPDTETDTDDNSNMVSGDSDNDTETDSDSGGGSNMVSGGSNSDPDTDADAEDDADTDTDSDSDADVDEDADADSGSNTGAEAEEVTDTEGVEDIDSGTDSDTDVEQFEDPVQPDGNETDTPAESPGDGPVSGDPGTTVDCDNTLPCRWTSEDTQFTVTVTNADNIGSRERLQLNYSLGALHDTEVSVTGGGQALDDTGILFEPAEQLLGSGASGTSRTLVAGATMDGSIVFDRGSESTTLATWSVTILDGGLARMPSFTNIPVGTITTAYADCEGALPCVWETPGGDVSITLTTAGGYSSNGQLATTFTVLPQKNMNVAVDAGTTAISSDGFRFEGRTHSLGSVNNYKKISIEAYADYGLNGSVNFSRNSATPTMLDQLSLILYQDSPVPRWNPRFVNIPVQP